MNEPTPEMIDAGARRNPLGIHTECGPLNIAGRPIHLHIWPMNADHTMRWTPVPYVGKHRRKEDQ